MSDPLVGKWFHTWRDQRLAEQGWVQGVTDSGYYLCFKMSWIDGNETYAELHTIEEMRSWWFYPDNDAMNFSYEHGPASRAKRVSEQESEEEEGR